MFQLHQEEAGKKKKPRKWRKNHPISDKEFLNLISQIRSEKELSDEEIMERVKDYYGTPFTPEFRSGKFSPRSKSKIGRALNFFWVVFFAVFFILTISYVSGNIFSPVNPEKPVLPGGDQGDVVFQQTD